MNKPFLALAALLATVPGVAHAQDGGKSPLAGPHIGIEVSRNSLEANQRTSTKDASRGGIGIRGNLGYDVVLGNSFLLGAEAVIGTGGRTVSQPSLAGGRYRVDPGITYDVTARAGLVVGDGFALYGRAGYRWLRTEQTITGQAANNSRRKVTEGGVTYGAGLEYALSDNFSLRAEYNRTRYSKDLRQSQIALGASLRF